MARPATRPIRYRRNNHPPTRRLNMTTNHIDQLAQWWDEAEVGGIEKGDTVINRSEGETTVYVATVRAHRQHPSARILARAPKPKPAWHDAVAVIAETGDDDTRRAFVPQYNAETGDERLGTWADWQDGYDASELIDPVPLIEAKVTDEMVLAALNASTGLDMLTVTSFKRDEIEDMRLALTAALGLETP